MFERKGRREVSCRQIDAWLMAYLKDGLAPDRRAAVDEHLAGCEVCRHAVRDARALEASLCLEAARYNPTLSPTVSARIQERVYRRMRRGLIMQRTSRVVGGAAGVVVALVLVAGALLLWQTLRAGEPAGGGCGGGQSVRVEGALAGEVRRARGWHDRRPWLGRRRISLACRSINTSAGSTAACCRFR